MRNGVRARGTRSGSRGSRMARCSGPTHKEAVSLLVIQLVKNADLEGGNGEDTQGQEVQG